MNNPKKKVLAVVSDLMFTVKIQDAAKRAGLDVIFVTSREKALKEAKLGPNIIILDLNGTSVDALELIGSLKSDPETSAIDLLGYVSHVQVDLKQAALEKGCDQVVARSAFSENLPAILARY
jgi:PleD family two-component response regulator